jgi:hypothetical protein
MLFAAIPALLVDQRLIFNASGARTSAARDHIFIIPCLSGYNLGRQTMIILPDLVQACLAKAGAEP